MICHFNLPVILTCDNSGWKTEDTYIIEYKMWLSLDTIHCVVPSLAHRLLPRSGLLERSTVQGHLPAWPPGHMTLHTVISNRGASLLSARTVGWMNGWTDGWLFHKTLQWNEHVWECWGGAIIKWVRSLHTIAAVLWKLRGRRGETLLSNYGHK